MKCQKIKAASTFFLCLQIMSKILATTACQQSDLNCVEGPFTVALFSDDFSIGLRGVSIFDN
jgi:hypothetical protein